MYRHVLLLSALFLACLSIANAQTVSSLQINSGETPQNIDVLTVSGDIVDGIVQVDSTVAEDGQVALVDLGDEVAIAVSSETATTDHDLVLVSASGTVLTIVRRAAAGSRNVIAFSSPVAAIVQLPGGAARTSGIEPGGSVAHAIFGNLSDETE